MNTNDEPHGGLFSTLVSRIEGDFFRPMPPTTLALARIVVFGLIAWKALSRPWYLLADWPHDLVKGVDLWGWDYRSSFVLKSLTVVLACAAALGVVGVLTRIAAIVSLWSLFLLNAIDGGAFDSGWLLASFLLLMACSRADDSLSLKNLFAGREPSAESWEYRWPLRVMQLSALFVYFQTGLFKLTESGFDWFAAETLQGWYLFHLWADSHYFEWGELLIRHSWLAVFSSVTAIFVECGCVAIVFEDRLKWFFVPALFGMHVIIGLTLNIWFTEYFFILLLFFDWHAIVQACRRGLVFRRHG